MATSDHLTLWIYRPHHHIRSAHHDRVDPLRKIAPGIVTLMCDFSARRTRYVQMDLKELFHLLFLKYIDYK